LRLGIIADIHGNLEALNSFLSMLSQKGFDTLVVGGDIVGYGADPIPCLETVLHHKAILVAGNHDWAATGRIGTDYFNEPAKQAIDWTRQQLSEHEREILHTLPLETTVHGIHVSHSNPVDPGSWEYLTDYSDAQKIGSELFGIHIIGHSHVPFIYGHGADIDMYESDPGMYKLVPRWSYMINVGSIGQPRDGIPLASGALLDTVEQYIELLRVPYPIHRAADKIRNEPGLPDYLAIRLYGGS